jgi:hypothetical protein
MTYTTAIQAAVECVDQLLSKLYTCGRIDSKAPRKNEERAYKECNGEM